MVEFREAEDNGGNGDNGENVVKEEGGGSGDNGTIGDPMIPEISKISNRKDISIDDSIETVVKYQDEGKEIFFGDDEDNFLILSPEDIAQLNPMNKTKYTIACGVRYQTLNLNGIKDNHKVFKPRAGFASATARLEIRGGDPNKHYAWKRPDELQAAAYEGAKICDDPNVQTFGGVDEKGRSTKGGGSKTVSANGVDELVLVEKPKEMADARRDAIGEKSTRRNKAVEKTAEAELTRLGGQPFTPVTGGFKSK